MVEMTMDESLQAAADTLDGLHDWLVDLEDQAEERIRGGIVEARDAITTARLKLGNLIGRDEG